MARNKQEQPGLRLSGFEWWPSTPPTEDSITFAELKKWAALKLGVKHGPKLKRRALAQYVVEEARKAGVQALTKKLKTVGFRVSPNRLR